MPKRKTTAEFIKQANEVHKNRYDYSLVEYINNRIKIRIICPEHGVFEQAPSAHLKGQGCFMCGLEKISKNQRISKEEFINRAKKIHKKKYDYSLANYINMKTKIKIICPEHGIFEQQPNNHLNGRGCPSCANNKKRDLFAFQKVANKLHENKYQYNSEYINNNSKIKIICPQHGMFEQTPGNHISKKCGCPACAEYGFNPNKPATLYYLLDQETGLYKIGITNKTIEERFPNADGSKRNMIILEQTYYENGYEALEAEQEILEAFSYCRCTNESWPEAWGGRTEFFKEDILLKDS